MTGVPVFTRASVRTECDVCEFRFDPLHGGVCERCERILCMKHLHGSWLRRLRVDLGARSVCVECRAGVGPTKNKEALTNDR
jgi:hypothetical protein